MDSPSKVAKAVRALANLGPAEGPDDKHISGAVAAFAAQFEYWYVRVIREAVPEYRRLIIKRINPFIRRIEFEGLSSSDMAARLVEDYTRRNFVTAGGWALEAMARAGAVDVQKSGAAGIDLQRFDPETGDYYLYVLKSGLVTRNSDIVNALKGASRKAEKLLKQDRSTGTVHAHYAILAGKTTASFEDGVHRPASGDFWGDMFRLPPDKAIDLALGIAATAGSLIRHDASEPIAQMTLLVETYIGMAEDPTKVDWEFLATLTLRQKSTWEAADRARHANAVAALKAAKTGT